MLSEVVTWPKPGLVDPVEHGAHPDMDVFTFIKSATSLRPYFYQAAIPSTIFSIWHNISGSALSSWWRNHSQEENSDDNRSTEAVVTTD
ncbi:hypothetical protein HCZ00_02065 [Limosilactobacillus fermentum]